MPPTITALWGALLALLLVVLALRVAAYRLTRKIGIGDGADRELLKRVRAHGNAAEYIPLGIVLLLLAELCGVAPNALHASGAALFVSRLLHGVGLSRSGGASLPRFVGILGTWFAILALIVLLLIDVWPWR